MTPKTEISPLTREPGGIASLARNQAGEWMCSWGHHDEDGDWLCTAKMEVTEDGEVVSKLVSRERLEGNA